MKLKYISDIWELLMLNYNSVSAYHHVCLKLKKNYLYLPTINQSIVDVLLTNL